RRDRGRGERRARDGHPGGLDSADGSMRMGRRGTGREARWYDAATFGAFAASTEATQVPEWAVRAFEWLQARPLAAAVVGLALLSGMAWLAFTIVRRYVLRIITRLTQKSTASWDEVLVQHRVFHRLAWLVPPIVVYEGIEFVPHFPAELGGLVRRVALATPALLVACAPSALLASTPAPSPRPPT